MANPLAVVAQAPPEHGIRSRGAYIPLLAWCAGSRIGWSRWHVETALNCTRCGLVVPPRARVSSRTATASNLPAETCATCWPAPSSPRPTSPAGAAAVDPLGTWARWILTGFAQALRAQADRLAAIVSGQGPVAAHRLRELAAQVDAHVRSGRADPHALLAMSLPEYLSQVIVLRRAAA